ncbi:hypothetical protein TTHERM_00138070 (macronuclear) [Tetrahymena thermophila SB210]|uniref:Uncharacterized protein n=1 Tax=Tetrahymena thermophila (strain SB210) TaxID=312017 RepID=I7M289_TETTS|nr:hypothetical protein TTHERM_00138070 [Tetrahymena thermophila SB210]EAR99544.1 hypothetical protein TTHERM_00138070 [Tetrahymena thermophila SB210]|eukprot:XP_001019789.1 hypothetical protein TTHERM_00138070 [Tetrahymena thermophila SB210]
MGCYNSKAHQDIMKQKKDLQKREKYLGQANSGCKITSDQLDKMRTKCDNENPNQDVDKNEYLNDLQDNKNFYLSKQGIEQDDIKREMRPSIENQFSQQNQVENNQVSISKQQLQNIIEQEGFQEKIHHINKIYSFLLQSQDEGFDHCSFDDPDLTDFLSHLQTKYTSPQDQQAVKSNKQIRRDTRGETIIDIPSETPEKLQTNLQGLINAVLSSNYRLITSPTQASLQGRPFQLDRLLQNTYSTKNILTLGTADACSNSPSSIDRTDQNKNQTFAQRYSNIQCLSPPKINFSGFQNPSSFTNVQTPKKNITTSIQQQPLYTISEEKKGGEGLEDHFDHEEELKTNKHRNTLQQTQLKKEESIKQKNETKQIYNRQSTENQNTRNKSFKNISQADAVGSMNSTTTKTKNLTIVERNQRVSLSDIKKSISPHSICQIHVNNLAQQSEQQAQISLYRHSINFNDISLQEIEQDFKDYNSQKPQIQVSSFALRCQDQSK